MSNLLTLKDFKVLFMGELYALGEDLAERIQEEFYSIPDRKLSVRKVEIKWPKVKISINRKEPCFYGADKGEICGHDAYIFTGNIWETYETNGTKGNFTLPMPEETYSCVQNNSFPINTLLKDYNHLVGSRNWLRGLSVTTSRNYFTIEYQF